MTAYDAILGAIRANVGDPQPPLVGAHALFTVVCANGSLSVDAATTAMDATLDNDHALRWTDGDGTVRYALTTAGLAEVRGTNPYGPADADALRACIATEADRADPDRAFIGWANERLGEL